VFSKSARAIVWADGFGPFAETKGQKKTMIPTGCRPIDCSKILQTTPNATVLLNQILKSSSAAADQILKERVSHRLGRWFSSFCRNKTTNKKYDSNSMETNRLWRRFANFAEQGNANKCNYLNHLHTSKKIIQK
jgi:hypothetical protein